MDRGNGDGAGMGNGAALQMPRLSRPHAPPSLPGGAQGSLASVSSTSRRGAMHADEDADRELLMAPSPPPRPHSHPLSGMDSASSAHSSAVFAAAQSRARTHNNERLDPTFWNRDRVNALANADVPIDSADGEDDDTARPMYSTRVIQQQIARVRHENAPVRVLSEDARRYAATEASDFRPRLMFPTKEEADDQRSELDGVSLEPDSALARARYRKVKKQVDAKWLQTRQDPQLRPLGPLERPDEMHYYETPYMLTLQDLLEEGVICDAKERAAWKELTEPSLREMPIESRGSTGLYGCCFDTSAWQG